MVRDELLPYFRTYRSDAKSAHNTAMLLSVSAKQCHQPGYPSAGEKTKET